MIERIRQQEVGVFGNTKSDMEAWDCLPLHHSHYAPRKEEKAGQPVVIVSGATIYVEAAQAATTC